MDQGVSMVPLINKPVTRVAGPLSIVTFLTT